MVSSTPDNQLGIRLILTSASAIVAEASTFPIDITKTRLQLQDLHCGVTRGAIRTAIGITQEEGFRGLYKGLPPALLRHVFYTSTRIATYEQLRTMMGTQESRHNQSMAHHALLGGISGMVGQVLICIHASQHVYNWSKCPFVTSVVSNVCLVINNNLSKCTFFASIALYAL